MSIVFVYCTDNIFCKPLQSKTPNLSLHLKQHCSKIQTASIASDFHDHDEVRPIGLTRSASLERWGDRSRLCCDKVLLEVETSNWSG